MHSQLKSASKACSSMRDLKAARGRCHSDFKGCAREIQNGGPGCVTPTFGEEAATSQVQLPLSLLNYF